MSKKNIPISEDSDAFRNYDPEKAVQYYRNQAEAAFAERDKAKAKLREAVQSLSELESEGSLSKHVQKFIRDFDITKDKRLAIDQVNAKDDHFFHLNWFLDRVAEIEETNHMAVRVEGSAGTIRWLRHFGMSIFKPWVAEDARKNGQVGVIEMLSLPVFLNNTLKGIIRFFVKPIALKPFDFPCEPDPKINFCTAEEFRSQIMPSLTVIWDYIKSNFEVIDGPPPSEDVGRNVSMRPTAKNKEEFMGKEKDIKHALTRELQANKARFIYYPDIWIQPDPPRLRYDIVISITFKPL